MRSVSFLFFFISFFSVQAQANSEDAKSIISQAIERFENTSREQWFYQINRFENEEGDISRSLEQHDPSALDNKHWTLLSINGEIPSEGQIQDFDELKNNKKAKSDYTITLRKLIKADTEKLLEDTPEAMHFSFDVNLERLGKKASEKLSGTLVYNKQHEFIETITVVNTDTFSPVFSAKIKNFNLTLTFIQIDDAILPFEQKLMMKGTFAIFSEIDEVSTDTFSKYQFVGQSAE